MREGRAGRRITTAPHADAANMVAARARAARRLLFYRGFVLRPSHGLDGNPKNDRARAAYDNFHALDGQFELQRGDPDQKRAYRFFRCANPPRAFRRASRNQPGRRIANHPGVIWARRGTPYFWCRCGKRLSISTCRRRRIHACESAGGGQDLSSPGRRLRRRGQRGARR